jgi:hypothetical protein
MRCRGPLLLAFRGKGGAVTAIPKPTPDRDAAYRVWLREGPCVVCNANPPSEVHHLDSSGMGTKGSDYEAIPVCRRCHGLLQTREHEVLRMRYAFSEVEAWKAAGRLYRQWVNNWIGNYRVAPDGETLVYDGPGEG